VKPIHGKAVDYHSLGDARQRKGDLAGAIADYTKGIELNPHDVACYHSRGDARLDKKDLEGAIADFTKAIELKPIFYSKSRKSGCLTREAIARK
jgi:tetratricopeptide (TPR) repeat protein